MKTTKLIYGLRILSAVVSLGLSALFAVCLFVCAGTPPEVFSRFQPAVPCFVAAYVLLTIAEEYRNNRKLRRYPEYI